MNATEQHLKRIQDKLHTLLKQFSQLQKENLRLTEELGTALEKLNEQQKHAEELRQQVQVLKMSQGEMTDPERKEFEKKINGYIKEIDRCIALLGA